jgi:hypothetical protein
MYILNWKHMVTLLKLFKQLLREGVYFCILCFQYALPVYEMAQTPRHVVRCWA